MLKICNFYFIFAKILKTRVNRILKGTNIWSVHQIFSELEQLHLANTSNQIIGFLYFRFILNNFKSMQE